MKKMFSDVSINQLMCSSIALSLLRPLHLSSSLVVTELAILAFWADRGGHKGFMNEGVDGGAVDVPCT